MRVLLAVACALMVVAGGSIAVAKSETPPVRSAAFVGDSITNCWSPDFNEGHAPGLSPASWVNVLLQHHYRFAGGWAQVGAHTRDMLNGVKPVHADVLVILAGTNDVYFGDPFSETAANLKAIVARAGVKTVVISAIPPMNGKPGLPGPFNAKLKVLAKAQGWHWVDGWVHLRDGRVYRKGISGDGIHPFPAGEKVLGETLLGAVDRVLDHH